MKTLIKLTSTSQYIGVIWIGTLGNAFFVSIPLIRFTHFADIEQLP